MGGTSRDQKTGLYRLMERYPTEAEARRFFEQAIWGSSGRCCGHCGSLRTYRVAHRSMPFKCSDCARYFSVRTGTVLARSNLSLRKWLFAIYAVVEHPKGTSSLQLAKLLDIAASTSWHMGHRVREALAQEGKSERFDGPVEVDEVYIGGRKRNWSQEKRRRYKGRGTVGKIPIAGVFDRATGRVSAAVVPDTSKRTLQRFVRARIREGTTVVYTDELQSYTGLERHKSVNHSAYEFVRGDVHTNNIESFWSTLKRSHKGVYHRWSRDHLQRYVHEFCARFNLRHLGSLAKMERVAFLMAGRRLSYRDLVSKSPQVASAQGGS